MKNTRKATIEDLAQLTDSTKHVEFCLKPIKPTTSEINYIQEAILNSIHTAIFTNGQILKHNGKST